MELKNLTNNLTLDERKELFRLIQKADMYIVCKDVSLKMQLTAADPALSASCSTDIKVVAMAIDAIKRYF
jgi:hypothetical protein